jgi:two-component system chemotaxis response regulator CheB
VLEQMLEQKATLKAMPDVLMVSSQTRTGSDITMKALNLGAFDFVAKPGVDTPDAQDRLVRMLQHAVNAWKNRRLVSTHVTAPAIVTNRIARNPPGTGTVPARTVPGTGAVAAPTAPVGGAKVAAGPPSPSGFTYSLAVPTPHTKPVMAIVLGVSTGGPKSLADMMPTLCAATDLPILLVQHMPPHFTKSLADSLDLKCKHKVVEGAPGMVVEPKHVYIAPGGSHMIVRTRGSSFVLETNQDPPENGCRPSVDVLFRSAAQAYPTDSLVGVILTGMGNDGTPSLINLKKQNAYLIAQNEESSVVFGMPRAAAATGLLDKVAPLARIPDAVVERIQMVKK